MIRGSQIIADDPGPPLKRDEDAGCKLHEACLECPELDCGSAVNKRKAEADRKRRIALSEYEKCGSVREVHRRTGMSYSMVRYYIKGRSGRGR